MCRSIISKWLGPCCCPLWVIIGTAVPGANLFVFNRIRPSCQKSTLPYSRETAASYWGSLALWASLRLIGLDTRNSTSINTVDFTWEMPAPLWVSVFTNTTWECEVCSVLSVNSGNVGVGKRFCAWGTGLFLPWPGPWPFQTLGSLHLRRLDKYGWEQSSEGLGSMDNLQPKTLLWLWKPRDFIYTGSLDCPWTHDVMETISILILLPLPPLSDLQMCATMSLSFSLEVEPKAICTMGTLATELCVQALFAFCWPYLNCVVQNTRLSS